MFLVPYGKIGRDFIDQVTSHINDWNNSSDNCHVSLKAAFVCLAVGLQKPGPKSKGKDHQDALWLSDLSCGEKVKSANYYANAELFKVELEN